jgi:hypothetical protein
VKCVITCQYLIDPAESLEEAKRIYETAGVLQFISVRWIPPEAEGPGTELKKLLAKFKITPAANCKCNQHIHEMNQKGVAWCEQNINTIVDWLHEEAQRANLLFTTIGAKILIKRAIHNARKKEKHRQKVQAVLQG